MDIFSKIKSYLKLSTQDEYIKIREILEVSDIKINGRINFKVSYLGSSVPFWLNIQEGTTPEMAEIKIKKSLDTVATKLAAGQNLVEISQALKSY